MRRVALFLLVLLSGCYSLGPVVFEVRPTTDANGRPEIEVRRCLLAWGAMKQLQAEDCKIETLPLADRARRVAK